MNLNPQDDTVNRCGRECCSAGLHYIGAGCILVLLPIWRCVEYGRYVKWTSNNEIIFFVALGTAILGLICAALICFGDCCTLQQNTNITISDYVDRWVLDRDLHGEVREHYLLSMRHQTWNMLRFAWEVITLCQVIVLNAIVILKKADYAENDPAILIIAITDGVLCALIVFISVPMIVCHKSSGFGCMDMPSLEHRDRRKYELCPCSYDNFFIKIPEPRETSPSDVESNDNTGEADVNREASRSDVESNDNAGKADVKREASRSDVESNDNAGEANAKIQAFATSLSNKYRQRYSEFLNFMEIERRLMGLRLNVAELANLDMGEFVTNLYTLVDADNSNRKNPIQMIDTALDNCRLLLRSTSS